VADRSNRSLPPGALAAHRSPRQRGGRKPSPDTNLLRRGRELDFGLPDRLSAVDRGRRAHDVVAGSNAFVIGLRAGDRFVESTALRSRPDATLPKACNHGTSGSRCVSRQRGRDGWRWRVFQPAEIDVPSAPIFRAAGRRGASTSSGAATSWRRPPKAWSAFTLLLALRVRLSTADRVVANGRTVFEDG
jgi:hypothetical protein